MGENNVSIIPDVVKSASEAIHTNIPETVKETDEVLSTVVGLFNNVVLYPIKMANLTFKYKLEKFEKDLQDKIKDVPEENLQIPPTMIAGPALEALRYAYDEESLREMYENLLASAMDNRKDSRTHPAFVEIIRQFSPLDAKIMSTIAEYKQLRCAEIIFAIKDTGMVYMHGMPKYFSPELFSLGNPFDISASITNLKRLGLVEVVDRGLNNTDYEEIENHSYVMERKAEYDTLGKPIEIQVHRQGININNYGDCFVEICLGRADYHAN